MVYRGHLTSNLLVTNKPAKKQMNKSVRKEGNTETHVIDNTLILEKLVNVLTLLCTYGMVHV